MQDAKKSLNLQLGASHHRIKELQTMYDKLNYNAERERKLEIKLKKAKDSIKMHRNYTRSNTLNLHATADSILTMEQFRKVSKRKKSGSVTSFLTDIERLGLKSNMGKKLILNAGYTDVTTNGGGKGSGVFVNNDPTSNMAMLRDGGGKGIDDDGDEGEDASYHRREEGETNKTTTKMVHEMEEDNNTMEHQTNSKVLKEPPRSQEI
jgi:hypothetical protein